MTFDLNWVFRARRRRRYGRGPNKYDRTWEDEEAYSRPRGRGGASTGQRGGPSFRGTERSERGGGADEQPVNLITINSIEENYFSGQFYNASTIVNNHSKCRTYKNLEQ